MKKVTYKTSGVDINAAGIFKSKIKNLVKSSFDGNVLKDIGGFGGFYNFAQGKFKEPVLVSSADGVGTKLKIAALVNKHDTVGIDAVAMNVNDILCTGARPLFFLDYIAYSKVGSDVLQEVIKGLNQGCIQSGCALIGGETAQMPDIYKPGEYDLAGFCVGVVERNKIIDGSKIAVGDVIIGLESSGIHSNGYSLVRKVFSKQEVSRMANELLKPTRIYVKQVLEILDEFNSGKNLSVHGISHITGGSFYDKVARILPANMGAKIFKSSWKVPQIFQLVQMQGNVSQKDMYHTLNMGLGMVLVVNKGAVKAIQDKFCALKLKNWVVGEIVSGNKEVEII
jgi:phosphoribosylformylglycinamidine cyclo-ligase